MSRFFVGACLRLQRHEFAKTDIYSNELLFKWRATKDKLNIFGINLRVPMQDCKCVSHSDAKFSG